MVIDQRTYNLSRNSWLWMVDCLRASYQLVERFELMVLTYQAQQVSQQVQFLRWWGSVQRTPDLKVV